MAMPFAVDGTGNENSKIAEENNALNLADLPEYTLEELQQFDGTGPDKKLYLGIKGQVFDISKSYSLYGPGTAYARFAGRDATRGLAIFEVVPSDEPIDIETLTEQQRESLDNWEKFYLGKYPIIGQFRPQQPAATKQRTQAAGIAEEKSPAKINSACGGKRMGSASCLIY